MARNTSEIGNARSGPPQVGEQVGPFTITEVGGSGPLGQEYFAADAESGDRVVLRFLPRLVMHASKEVVRAFLQEAQAAAGVRHSNVTRLLKVGKDGGELYIVTEFAEGVAEADLIAGGEPLSPLEATRVVREVALALSAIHRQGLTHRDVQPANIVRAPDGRIRLTQLGLVRATEELQQFKLGIPIATPAYCSPELYQGGNIDGRTDVYSLGATYFALLTGRQPFVADTSMQVLHKHTVEPVPDPRTVRPDVPEACFKFLKKAMAKRPEERFAGTEQMAGELARLMQSFPQEEADPFLPAVPSAGPATDPLSDSLTDAVRPAGSLTTTRVLRRTPTTMLTGMHKPAATGSGGSAMTWIAVGGAAVIIVLIVLAVNLMSGPARRETDRAKSKPGVPPAQPDRPPEIDIRTDPPVEPGAGPAPLRDPSATTAGGGSGTTEPDIGAVSRPTPTEGEPEPPGPPADSAASLFSDRLVGWQPEGPGWSFTGGTVVGEHKDGAARVVARLPWAAFDLSLQVNAVSAEFAALDFHGGPGGYCRLSITPKGFLRLEHIHDRGREQLGFRPLTAGPHRLRLIVRDRRIEVFADGRRVLHVADGPPSAAADPKLTLVSVKGRSEFSSARWSVPAGTGAVDARRAVLTAMARFNDPAAVTQLRRTLAADGTDAGLAADCVRLLAVLSAESKAVEGLREFAARDNAPAEPLGLAVAALATVGGDVGLVERRLRHADAAVRAAAVGALAALSPGAADKIVPMLADRDRLVRRAAIAAVSRLRAEAALPALAAALRDPAVRPEAAAAVLSLAEPFDGWTTLDAVSAESSGGVKFVTLSDGSLLATGPDPDRDTYTLRFRTPLKGITGLRLDLLTDPSLTGGGGPGRSDNGNLVLNELRAAAQPAAGGATVPVVFRHVFADRVQQDWPAEAAVDGKPDTGWAVAAWTHHQPCSLFLETAADLGFDGGTLITVQLDQQFGGRHTIGRLRLRATTAARPLTAPARSSTADVARFESHPIFLEALLTGLLEDSVRGRCVALVRSAPGLLGPITGAARAGRLTPEHIAALRTGYAETLPIRDLHVAGPFPHDPAKDPINIREFIAKPDYSRKYPGADGREAAWRRARADDNGRLDLRGFYGSDQKWSALGHFTIDSPDEGETECRFEVDDELTLWVNGERFGTARIGGERTLPVLLRKGVNHVVFRVDNDGGGDWWFRLRIGRTGLPHEIGRPAVLCLFEDEDAFVRRLHKDTGRIALETADKYSGAASLLVGPSQRYDERIPGWFFPIVEKPALPGQYRFLRFAWKKRGGNRCAVQIAADGAWEKDGKGWRFFAGTGSPWPSAKVLAGAIPDRWQVHTVDLFKEFGPFVITGLAVSPDDGEFMLLDHVYLARTAEDLARVPTPGN